MRWTFQAVALVAGVASALFATPASARQAVGVLATVSPAAEALEREARALYEQPDRYERAAGLHLRAADLRAPGDPQRIHDLRQSGRLFYYAGSKPRALDIMQRAGDEALSNGDVLAAALALLDAASIAQELRRGDDVLRLVQRTELLLTSPLLPAADRELLTRRVQLCTTSTDA
jgi:hypothetical protein